MDGHIQMRKCGQIRNTCTECWREMGGGGGHLMGTPTNQKDGLWGQWWAKLPQVLEWQGQMGRAKCRVIWPEMEGGMGTQGKCCQGELGGGGGAPKDVRAPQKKGPWGQGVSGVTQECR